MDVIIFNGCTVKAPDVSLAFSNAWAIIKDTTGTASTATTTSEGVTETINFYEGMARFSMLPYIRSRQVQDAQMFAVTSKFAHELSVTVKVDGESGTLGTATYTQMCIFGSTGIDTAYTGTRYITYNEMVTESAVTLMIGEQGATFTTNGGNVQTIERTGVIQNELLSTFIGASQADKFIIRSDETFGTVAGESVQDGITIHVTRDKRTKGIVCVRWIDYEGKVNYRTFASGTKSQNASTTSSYAKTTYNTELHDGVNVGKDNWVNKAITNAITFGDDCVPVNQYEWIASLFASSLVEVKVNGVWTRCAIDDAEISMATKKHLFNCSAVAILPSVEVMQW